MRDFLRGHSCYELIPESGKVVLLDTGLPIRQAFHALHEQVTLAVFGFGVLIISLKPSWLWSELASAVAVYFGDHFKVYAPSSALIWRL